MTAPLEAVGTMYATFIDPDGNEVVLSYTGEDLGHFTTPDISGWGAPPYEYSTDPHPRGGVTVRHIRAEAARIVWPMYVFGETYTQFTNRYRKLRRAFSLTAHRKQPGLLRVALPDGTRREIEVFLEEGFGGKGEMWLFANPVITFLAPDPYWRDVEFTTVPRQYGVSQSYLAPFPSVSSSQLLGGTTVDNPGDVAAWPEWTITGPMSSLRATNETSGQSFTLIFALANSTQTIKVTTFQPTVRGPAGQNLADALDWPDAELWALLPEINDIDILLNGAGPGSSIELAYKARYEGV